ncbi:hypothetical protein Ari01nite_98980 [Paractinoplanes rishiriensis]|uniref:Uncharacterized protein n=1 Tax=Paractinoplanes rishiriensis TaxID=1050105 RepID=A0A919K9E5_9ACTN|nr:hypothetical protein Ari01nite_98980 [Actinoplanes rishiriensis]
MVEWSQDFDSTTFSEFPELELDILSIFQPDLAGQGRKGGGSKIDSGEALGKTAIQNPMP